MFSSQIFQFGPNCSVINGPGTLNQRVWAPHRLASSLKQQTPITVSKSSIRGMVGMMM